MERGPTRITCTCGDSFLDVTSNEANYKLEKHIREKAEEDDLLHFMENSETVEWSPGGPEGEVQELAVISNDIARQLHLRNFGESWTSRQEADLMRQLLEWVVRKEHVANHQTGDQADEVDWRRCRRMACTYVALTIGGGA